MHERTEVLGALPGARTLSTAELSTLPARRVYVVAHCYNFIMAATEHSFIPDGKNALCPLALSYEQVSECNASPMEDLNN